MATPYVISISSDEDDDSDDIEILEFRKQTQELINNPQPPHNSTKKLSNIQCPICFDDVKIATTTTCGHIFCLDCISQSISSSHARGQVRGRRGIGLCPLCRKSVSFKEAIVLRLKLATATTKPNLPELADINNVTMEQILEDNVKGEPKEEYKTQSEDKPIAS